MSIRSLPLTRGDCIDGPRPCPHLTCRHHLGPRASESCTLDVADRGGVSLEEVGQILGITRERVRQIEEAALVGYRRGWALSEREPKELMAIRRTLVDQAIERAKGGTVSAAPTRWRVLDQEQEERIRERAKARRLAETPEQRAKRLASMKAYNQARRARLKGAAE